MVDIAESTEKFNNLKQILLKHNEEFEDLYSSIGKEKVELDSLNQTLGNMKGELVEWSTRNKENSVEIGSLKSDINSIGKQLKEKDVSSKISDISRNLEMLADRMERIQKAEREILSQQDKMLRFDKGLKELVRKAVVASMSRREFESELNQLESAGGSAPAEATEDFEEAPAKPVRKPTEAEVQSKLAALRMNLQKPRAEDVAEEDLMKGFSAFEQELQSTDDPKALWATTRDQLLKIARSDLQSAKTTIKSLKDAGKDVSKAQLSATKFEIGLVSLETAFSLQSLEKAKEIAVKLSDLHRQLDSALEQLG
jgi:chromosome segregation ATPase